MTHERYFFYKFQVFWASSVSSLGCWALEEDGDRNGWGKRVCLNELHLAGDAESSSDISPKWQLMKGSTEGSGPPWYTRGDRQKVARLSIRSLPLSDKEDKWARQETLLDLWLHKNAWSPCMLSTWLESLCLYAGLYEPALLEPGDYFLHLSNSKISSSFLIPLSTSDLFMIMSQNLASQMANLKGTNWQTHREISY